MNKDICEHDNPQPEKPPPLEMPIIDLCYICGVKSCPKSGVDDVAWNKKETGVTSCDTFIVKGAGVIQFALRMGVCLGVCLMLAAPVGVVSAICGAALTVACYQADKAMTTNKKAYKKAHQRTNADEQQDIA